jgi:hypothetical protein
VRNLLWLPLAGCVVVSEMDHEEPCEQAIARYAQRMYACTEDSDLSLLRTDKLREAHQCRIEAWSGTGFLDTGWSAVQFVETDAGRLPLMHAWSCSETLAALSCGDAVEADPRSGWLETVAGCAQIFRGPDGTAVTTGVYGY